MALFTFPREEVTVSGGCLRLAYQLVTSEIIRTGFDFAPKSICSNQCNLVAVFLSFFMILFLFFFKFCD